MVADTENKPKRGRPLLPMTIAAKIGLPDKEIRTAQNTLYACTFIKEVMEERPGTPGSFFVNDKGNFKRQGIAEQLGRMYEAGLIDKDEGRQLANQVINDYKNGASVKELEKRLRDLRIIMAAER